MARQVLLGGFFLEKNMKYKFRGLPCNITTVDKLWYVAGSFGSGGGILEWCYNEDDAKSVMKEMEKDPRFGNLCVNKYQQ